MLRRSFFVAAALVAATLLTTSTAGAAVRPFNPPQTVVGGCETFIGDAVVTTGGSLLGFATCPAMPGRPIRFFSRTAGGTVNPSQDTGFNGDVLAATYDNTATYVLYLDGAEIRIGKRTTAGAYSSRAVDTWAGITPAADVIAKDGQWFGVWAKDVAPSGESPDLRLFSGSSTAAPAPVTVPPTGTLDYLPTLAYSGSTPVLIWTREMGPPGSSDLMVSKRVSGVWEAPRVFASAGERNDGPDMQIAAGRTFVTWTRDDKTWVASNHTGSFTTHAFATAGFEPTVGVSVTGSSVDHVFLSWSVFSTFPGPNHVFFAETASTGSVTGTWDGATLGPAVTRGLATGGFKGKGTVVYGAPNSVDARTQA